MNLDDLNQLLLTNAQTKTEDYTRLFHGRGNFHEGYTFLTVDSIDKVLFATFFESDAQEESIVGLLKTLYKAQDNWEALVIQKRYQKESLSEVIEGKLPDVCFAIEDGLRYKLNFLNSQNIGFFPDMKNGRSFVRAHAKGKNVLNLFAYTCSFSVAAIAGGAKSVVNVDMSKGALSIGRDNQRLNALDTKNHPIHALQHPQIMESYPQSGTV